MLKIILKITILLIFISISSCGHKINNFMYEGYAPINEGKIYYQIYGKGESMIVLHGGPGLDHKYLLPYMTKLAHYNQVVFYDQRGSGKSISTRLDNKLINIDQFVEDLEKLRQHLKYNKFILTGHSWGGLLAMKYAIKYPQHISSLILLDSAPATYKGYKAFLDEYARRATIIQDKLNRIQQSIKFTKGDAKTMTSFFKTIFSVYVHRNGDENKLNLNFLPHEALDGLKINSIFNNNFLASKYDFRNELKKLNINTLIINGSYDPVPLWTAKEIQSSIPNSQLFIINNSGHFPYVEQPSQFFNVIKGFLGK